MGTKKAPADTPEPIGSEPSEPLADPKPKAPTKKAKEEASGPEGHELADSDTLQRGDLWSRTGTPGEFFHTDIHDYGRTVAQFRASHGSGCPDFVVLRGAPAHFAARPEIDVQARRDQNEARRRAKREADILRRKRRKYVN